MLRRNGSGERYRGLQLMRTSPAAVFRTVPCGVHSVEESGGTKQDSAAGEYVCAATPDSGAVDQPNREVNPGTFESAGSGSDHRSAASVHGDARSGKTKLNGHYERDAGSVSRKQANARRIFVACQFAEALIWPKERPERCGNSL